MVHRRLAKSWVSLFATIALFGAGSGCDGAEPNAEPTGGGGTAAAGGSGAGGDETTGSGGDETTGEPTGGSGGSGGGAGGETASGGAGTGGGAGGSGGGDFIPGGDAGPLCQALCTIGTCVGDTCFLGTDLEMSLEQSDQHPPDGPIHSIMMKQCGYKASGPLWSIELTGTFGACAIAEVKSANPMLENLDGGAGTVQSPSLGTVDLPAPDVEGACSIVQVFPGPEVPAGELVAFSAAGSADVPACSLAAAAPPPVTLSVPETLDPGNPLVIAWDPPSPPDLVYVFVPDTFHIWCQPVDPSQLVVPGSITALFAGSASFLGVFAYRSSTVTDSVDLDGMPVHVRASVSSTDTRIIDLAP